MIRSRATKASRRSVVAHACGLAALAVVALDARGTALHAQGTSEAPPLAVTSRSVMATLVAGRVAVDGRLDEPGWRTAAVAGDFVQQRPSPGAAATQRTEARVLYDADAVYIGMRMYDMHPDSITSILARRDYAGVSDWAQVIIDSYYDRRTGFRFAVNPAGVKKDVFHFDDGGGEDVGWDAIWDAAARVDSLGWTAEFRIPYSQLRFNASGDDRKWGINFLRDIARHDERSYWSPIPPDAGAFVSRLGELTGLGTVTAARRLEVVPYTMGRVTRAPGARDDPFFRRNAVFGTLGADLKYGLTSDLTLTATLNPDFGQVEADPSQVNLTAFETFFPERRPFFLEGSDIFRVNAQLPVELRRNWFGDNQPFYPRRIGRRPQGTTPADARYRDAPDVTTILGAVKLSGKTAGGWSIGALDAVGAEESARYVDSAGAYRSTTLEPVTNYALLRTVKDFRLGKSAVGVVVGATHRRLDDSATTALLRSAAYLGGVDGRHRFGGGRYEIGGALIGSLIRGSPAAIDRVQRAAAHYFQRPDADHLHYDPSRTRLGGFLADAKARKIAGSVRWGAQAHVISPGFETNDMGFQRTSDWIVPRGYVGYEDFHAGRHVRYWYFYANARAGWNFGGERVSTVFGTDAYGQLVSGWGGYVGFDHELESLTTWPLRGGPAIVSAPTTVAWAGVNSDARKRVSADVRASGWREHETGGHGWRMTPTVTVRPSSSVELAAGPSLSRNGDHWQYVSTESDAGEPRYVFGRIAQMTASVTARLNYTFTPTLSLELYAEPFLSAATFGGFKEVRSPRARRFAQRFRTFAPAELRYDPAAERYTVDGNGDGTAELGFDDPAFSIRRFQSNAVLRWEYRPGSTLFVVWSQGRSDPDAAGALSLARDARRLFAAPATNVLLVKMSYWWSK